MNEDISYIRRIWGFSRALDLALVDEEIERGFQTALGERHGEKVAYIALSLGLRLDLPERDLTLLLIAGLLHDIGAVGGFRRYHGSHRLLPEHCLVGEKIIGRFPSGAQLAPILRYHHETPDPARGAFGVPADQVPLLAKIISMADKIDVYLSGRPFSTLERERFRRWVYDNSGHTLFPEFVPLILDLAQAESFWLDLEQPDLKQICLYLLLKRSGVKPEGLPPLEWEFTQTVSLEAGFTEYLAATFADLIDQKSQFTFRHSASVAEAVELLARELKWDEQACQDIKIAGQLHDLGKLAVPKKILDKPGPLDAAEFAVIRTHTYFTHRLLSDAGFPDHIVEWAAYHHERLDGKGYPFALSEKKLTTGSRLMTAADIFAALTEERPYRAAMTPGQAMEIIRRGAGTSVDEKLVEVAEKALA